MYCKRCGNKLNDGDAFCASCGNRIVGDNTNKEIKTVDVEQKGNPVKKSKRSSGILTGLLIVIGSILVIGLILIVTGVISVGKKAENPQSLTEEGNLRDLSENEDSYYALKTEGPGYESGEKALGAYLHYFQDQDVDGMISCFAVESFCEEVDFKKQTEHLQAYMPYSNPVMPVFGNFSKDIFVKRRVADISKGIYNQYLALAAPQYVNGENAGLFIALNDYDGDADKMLDQLYDYTDDEQFKEDFSFKDRFADPYTLTDNKYGHEKNTENMKRYSDIYGAQNYESVVAEFEFGGKPYLMCADVIEYDEKWYLCSLGGNVGALLGIDAYHSGIVGKQYAGIIREEAPAAEEAKAAMEEAKQPTIKTVQDGKLTIVTNAAFPPYEYVDIVDGVKVIRGIDLEISRMIADELGLELVVQDKEFSSVIPAVQAGEADLGIAGMTVTDERLKNVNFTSTYVKGVQSIIVPEGSDIKTVDDLAGHKIGVQESTTGHIYCEDDFGSENVTAYSNGAMAVQALLTGNVDCVVIDNNLVKTLLEKNEGLVVLDTSYSEEDYAGAVSKDNKELLDAMNKILDAKIADGTVQKIIDEYIKYE